MWIHSFLSFAILGCSAATIGCHGGEHIVFELEWEGVDPSLGRYPPTLVLAETRIGTWEVDGQTTTKLEKAELSVVLGNRIDCDVPKLATPFPPGILLPPLVVSRDREHRLTIYTPGYVAATIYPEGVHNISDPVSKPGLLRAGNHVIATYLDTDSGGLQARRDSDGEPLLAVRLNRIPSTPLASYELNTFSAQVSSLDEAISGGHLRDLKKWERRVLADAIRLQYRTFVSARVRFDAPEETRTFLDPWFEGRTKPHYEHIQSWASTSRNTEPASRPGG